MEGFDKDLLSSSSETTGLRHCWEYSHRATGKIDLGVDKRVRLPSNILISRRNLRESRRFYWRRRKQAEYGRSMHLFFQEKMQGGAVSPPTSRPVSEECRRQCLEGASICESSVQSVRCCLYCSRQYVPISRVNVRESAELDSVSVVPVLDDRDPLHVANDPHDCQSDDDVMSYCSLQPLELEHDNYPDKVGTD